MIKSLLTTWETISKPEKTSLLRLLVKLEFIIGINTCTDYYKTKDKTKDKRQIRQKLQGRAIVIVSAYQEINEVINSREFP